MEFLMRMGNLGNGVVSASLAEQEVSVIPLVGRTFPGPSLNVLDLHQINWPGRPFPSPVDGPAIHTLSYR